MSESRAASWTYFPLYAVENGVCACRDGVACKGAGKHPRGLWGDLSAGDTIEGRPGEGRGIATGHRSGVFVLDVDNKHEGVNGFETLNALGELPPTYTVKTPTGGAHYYFQLPTGRPIQTSNGSRGGLGPGLDVRGEDGYVVAPGSRHKNGGVYEVADSSPIAPAPAWLLARPELYPSKAKTSSDTSNHRPISPAHPRWDELFTRGLEECKTAEPCTGNGESSARLGALVKRLLWDFELPQDVAAELILTHFSPRCTDPEGNLWMWAAHDVIRMVQGCASRDYDQGVAPEGWLERFKESLSKPTPAPAATVVERRKRNPAHQYTCKPGDVPNGDKTSTTFANVVSILATHEEWAGVFAFDSLKNKIRAVNPPIPLAAEHAGGLADRDEDAVVLWFELVGGFAITREMAGRAIATVAYQRAYNPVGEWLAGLPEPEGEDVFDGLAARLFGTSNPLYDTYLRKFMIGAVRRALVPGEQSDTVLVLQSPRQGDGKSTFVRTLFGRDPAFNEAWSIEDLPQTEIGHKDNSLAISGTWGVELAELDKLLRAQDTATKAFLSRCEDTYRPPYGKHMLEKPRQAVFVGTTNETDFLRDPSGSRRYWCIPVGTVIDRVWLAAHRGELWAEAYRLFLEGDSKSHVLTPEEELERIVDAEQFGAEDFLEAPAVEFLRGKPYVKLVDVLRVLRGHEPNASEARAKATLKRVGAISGLTPRPERARVWFVPERLSSLPARNQSQRN